MTAAPPQVVVLAGGYGGAKLSHGLAMAAAPDGPALTVVVNVADDLELHGLNVSPDLDTITYTLAGLADEERGWGVRDETWSAAAMLERYGAETWFNLGDRDIATHLRRTGALRGGATLTEATAMLVASFGINATILPASDDRIATHIRSGDEWLSFQDYFVRRGQRDRVDEIRFDGIDEAAPTPEVMAAIAGARLIVIAPSNPFVSVGAILAIDGIVDAVASATAPVVSVSPIVGGAALRGPADRMLASLGADPSAAGVAALYAERYPGLIDMFVIDEVDADTAAEVAETGVRVETTGTVMHDDDDRRRLGEFVLRHLPPG